MKNLKRRLLAVVLSLALVFSVTAPSFAVTTGSDGQKKTATKKSVKAVTSADVKTAIKEIGQSTINERIATPEGGSLSGDWASLGLNRYAGEKTDFDTYVKLSGWNSAYANNLVESKLSKLSSPTDYARTIIGLTSAGIDCTKPVAGINLFDEMLKDPDRVFNNYCADIYVLEAVSLAGYDMTGRTEGITSIEELINGIEQYDTNEGIAGYTAYDYDENWNPIEGTGHWVNDIDYAGPMIAALVKYKDNAKAQAMIDANVNFIKSEIAKSETGLLNSTWSYSPSSCTTAMAILGLSSAGVDAKEVNTKSDDYPTILDGLMSNRVGSTWFCESQGGDPDAYTTDQCLYALVAYDRMTEGKCSLFDGSDITVKPYIGIFKTKPKATPGIKKAKITWTAVKGAEKNEVYQSTSKASGFKKIKTLSAKTFTATGLKPGTVYYFYIKAVNGSSSSKSAVVSADVKVAAPAKIKAVAGKKKVTVAFSKSANAKKYYIYRSTKKTKGFKKVAAVKKLKYVDKKVKKGKAYFYKVKAVKSSSNISVFSKTVKTKKVK